jgi:bifunctional enzyme CysN/CysC
MSHADILDTDIHTFLARHENKDLLRFVAVGSVDDGKSTLIGRLLYDTGSVYEDHVRDATVDGVIDYSRLTDGLKAEREQGITIDVAYRYFTTARRKFIIADTPGHIQYTRNMATGASTADVAIILIDARLGVLQQSRRHAYIASLLGIRHLIVAVNKMDLVDFDEARFRELSAEFGAVVSPLRFAEVRYFPISAIFGDNIVTPSERTPYFDGGTILEYLETVDVGAVRNLDDFRLPVQVVLRPNLDYRAFAGQIASGVVRPGDSVVVMPSGVRSTVRAIDTWEGELAEAFAPQSVAIRLADEVDVSRGDVLCPVDNRPRVSRTFRAMLVWLAERPLDGEKSYLIKHAARLVRANFDEVVHRVDLATMENVPSGTLALNDIGCVQLTTHRPLVFDPYTRNRAMGAFIVIDSMTNNTVGAGMILPDETSETHTGAGTGVSTAERAERLGHRSAAVWITGLPASGKTALAWALERRLFDLGVVAAVIDPDDRPSDTYEPPDAFDSALDSADRITRAGLVAICAFTTPTEGLRSMARERIGADRFVEVYVDTPPEVCAARDGRGAFAPGGPASHFVAPSSPDVTIDGAADAHDAAVSAIVRHFVERRFLEA